MRVLYPQGMPGSGYSLKLFWEAESSSVSADNAHSANSGRHKHSRHGIGRKPLACRLTVTPMELLVTLLTIILLSLQD